MRQLITNLFNGDARLDLYLGVIETIEGILKQYPEDAWRLVALGDTEIPELITRDIIDTGLMGLGLSVEDGGVGGGFLGSALLTDMLSQRGLSSYNAILTPFCRRPVLDHGTKEQIEKYVIPSLKGDKTFCICVTEPNAGTNTFNITTRAVKKGDKWILNGQKCFISSADRADYGFLVAKTELDSPSALSVFMLDMKSPGIEFQRQNINVFANDNQYMLFFDDVELPEDALIGEEGRGGSYMFKGLNTERFMIAAMNLGYADLSLKITTQQVNNRALFGKTPIGAYQSVQHPLAQNKANIDAARLMLYYGLKLFDDGADAGAYANAAKLLATQVSSKMCDDAIQFHGGSSMDEDLGLVYLWKICRSSRFAPINNEMILSYIAEHVLGLPKSH